MTSKRPVAFLALVLLSAAASAATPEGSSPSAGVPPDWWTHAQQDIRASEYAVTWQSETALPDLPAAWQAPNRAQGFRTYFTGRGIRVIPRTEEQPSWEWGLALSAYGRNGAQVAAETARLATSVNRIDYDRGTILEWYVNTERGLEQGFTLYAPPGAAGGPLRIELTLTGSLSPAFAADGQAVDFATSGGVHAIHYAELRVTDARGTEVPAYMEGFAEAGTRGIRLVVDDRQSVYPLTIDPLASSPAWTEEGGQAAAELGFALSTAGDVNGDGYSDVIVGAHGYDNGQTNEGKLYAYYGSASGLAASPNWTAESNIAEARFGRAVSPAGDVNGDGYSDIVVGAQYYANTLSGEGAVFVYHGSDTGLDPGGTRPSGTPANANWRAFGGQTNAYLGSAVGTAGDVNGDGYSDVIVAAWRYDNVEADEGRVYVYHGSSTGLVASPNWTAESYQASADFGASVGTAGDVNGDGYADVIVGAWRYSNVEAQEGAVFVWYGAAAGLGSNGTPANADWRAEADQAYANFGFAAATAGDVNGDGYSDIVIGVPFYDSPEVDEGAAFVYHGSASGLNPGSRPVGTPANADFASYGNQADARLGWSVAPAGDVNGDGYADVAAGAHFYDTTGKPDTYVNGGRALVYFGSSSGLTSSPWTEDLLQTEGHFGTCVATAGDVNGDGFSDVIVGAAGFDNAYADEGKAFLYLGSAAGLDFAAAWTADSPQATAYFGYAVASAGDVNADGYADVAVGAPYFDNGETNEGRVFVYHGSSSGLPAGASPSWTAESNQTGAQFGYVLAPAGDVNGDGYGDLLVATPYYNASHGGAWVFHGSSTGLSKDGTRPQGTPANADWSKPDPGAVYNCGTSAAGAGDVNGDGYADVVVGCPDYLGGRVDVHHGSATGLATSASWTAHKDEANARLGYAVASAGDVNGDGYSDLVAGTYYGWAYVFHGSGSGLDQHGHRPSGGHAQAADWTATAANICFGCAVASAGDVNGDEYADVVIGAPYYTNVVTNQGMALVFHGSATGLDKNGTRPVGYTTNADWSRVEAINEAWYGFSVASAGDVNGDGFSDVVVGAAHTSMAYAYQGSAAGLSASATWTGGLGWSVASAGDVNGDGYSDVITGDYFANVNGQAMLYYGNDGAGKAMRVQQRRYDDTSQIAPLGKSESASALRLRIVGRGAMGRTRVKFERQVEVLGTPFGTHGTMASSSWVDTGTGGVGISEPTTGLTQGSVYHWRVRLRYDLARSPFQHRSRWMTVPWNGWQEGDLRMACSAPIPSGSPTVTESKSGSTATISWAPLAGATAYDLVRGDLNTLRSTGGDYGLATDRCIAANTIGTSATDSDTPAVGYGFYFLLRGENCGGVGTYNEGTPSQPGNRDTGNTDCP